MIDHSRNRIAHDFVAAFCAQGSRAYIENLEAKVVLDYWGDTALPVTINDGHPTGTFVCSPKVSYIDYPREELSRFPNKTIVPVLDALIGATGGILAMCDVDRIVHINNWMMSTNLPVDLDLSLVAEKTRSLASAYPAHILAMRSLTRRYSARLMDCLVSHGWLLLPSRQVFLVDDVKRDSFPRRDTKRDHKIWQQGSFEYEELSQVSASDAHRIAQLYAMLYLEKYSRLNPAFTPQFVSMTHSIGLIRYLALRGRDGVIQSFGGMHQSGGHATMPLIGYDTAKGREQGLYRLAFHAGSLYAARHGLHFNMSSGATAFKRTRGATAEMEFTAFFLRHLSAARRVPFGLLRFVAQNVGMPLLRKYGL